MRKHSGLPGARANLELVEAVESELGERMVGLAIDDEDLAELHTVRDAIDCVVANLEAEIVR